MTNPGAATATTASRSTWQAKECHQRGYRLVAKNPEFLRRQAMHLAYLALAGPLTRGLYVLAKQLPPAMATSNQSDRFDFCLAARLLLRQLQAAGKKKVRANLPRRLPLWNAESVYGLAGLEEFFRDETEDLAKAFDARNGNDYYARQIEETLQRPQTITPPPLASAE